MADVPLAVTIVLGAVPIVGAGIAGFVALTNTTGRRIERLKNLAEICSKLPKFERNIERLIVRELQGIQLKTDARYVRLRRLAVSSLVIYLAVLGITLLPVLYGTTFSKWLTNIAALVLILTSLVISTKLDRRKLELTVEKDKD